MTEKIFWEDPYLSEIETFITGVENNNIIVEKTIFFALSGGQESDHGFINDHTVLKALKNGKDIIYTLKDGHGLKPFDKVKIKIDWQRRYRLMKLHFAAELVLELVYQNFPDAEKIGAHISEDKARIDFSWDKNISGIFPVIEKKVTQIIEHNYEIESNFSNKELEKRYWKIPGFAQVSCGGTHLKKTGEIKRIELKRKNPGRQKERIEIYLRG